MTIDISAAEALAAQAAQSFSEGLSILAQKAANEAKLERLRLADEAERLEDLRLSLEEERRCLDRGFAQLAAEQRLEVSDSLPGSLSPIRRQTQCEPGSPLDIEADAGAGHGWKLSLPFRASTAPPAMIEDCQGTLTRCSPEDFLEILIGLRDPTEVAGSGGRVLVDFRPACFASLLKQADESEEDWRKPLHEQSDSARFRDLLEKFGFEGWIYQDIAQNLQVDSLLAHRGRRYAVLPPAGPEEATVLLDMYDVAVTVPPGWEVLNTGHRNFDEVIGELSKHGWGTSLLCVKNAEGGFSSYRTTLYTHGGPAGTLVSSDSKVLQAIDEGTRSERFKFSKGMVLSGRVVMVSSSGVRAGLRDSMRPPMTM